MLEGDNKGLETYSFKIDSFKYVIFNKQCYINHQYLCFLSCFPSPQAPPQTAQQLPLPISSLNITIIFKNYLILPLFCRGGGGGGGYNGGGHSDSDGGLCGVTMIFF